MRAFWESETAELSGADIMRLTGLGSGSAYPILTVLEEHGVLQSAWEEQSPETLKRPRRRLYKLTEHGAGVYERALADFAPSGHMALFRPREV
jgi:PadR family transcriptional regulator, regulatory protein PadR